MAWLTPAFRRGLGSGPGFRCAVGVRTLWLALLLLATAFITAPVVAQPCTIDSQCGASAGGYNTCLGDTLVQKRRICVGGSCQELETGRINCGPGSGLGTCQGNAFVRSGARCDAAAGRCAQTGSIQITCVKSCSCVGKTLTNSTGTCTAGSGCGRAVLRCKAGCTCDGEPRCTQTAQPPTPSRCGRG